MLLKWSLKSTRQLYGYKKYKTHNKANSHGHYKAVALSLHSFKMLGDCDVMQIRGRA